MALRLGLLMVDAFSAFALFLVVSWLRFGPDWVATQRAAGFDPFVIATAYAAAWVAALWIHDLYRLRSRWSIRSEVRDVLRADLLFAVATFYRPLPVQAADRSAGCSWSSCSSLQLVVTLASRISIRLALGTLRDRGHNRRFMLVSGPETDARRFADRVERHRELGLRVIGHLGGAGRGRAAIDRAAAHPRARSTTSRTSSTSRVVDEVAICLPPEHVALVEPITRLCEEEGKIVRIPVGALGLTLPGGRVEEFDGIPVLSLIVWPRPSPRAGRQAAARRRPGRPGAGHPGPGHGRDRPAGPPSWTAGRSSSARPASACTAVRSRWPSSARCNRMPRAGSRSSRHATRSAVRPSS